jgi:hypothetical protein
VALLALLGTGSCGTRHAAPGLPASLPPLDTLDGLASGRRLRSARDVLSTGGYFDGADYLEASPGAAPDQDGTGLLVPARHTGQWNLDTIAGYAVYAQTGLTAGQLEPVGVRFYTSSGGLRYIALANFRTGRWDMVPAIWQRSARCAGTRADYISPGGNTYCAALAWPDDLDLRSGELQVDDGGPLNDPGSTIAANTFSLPGCLELLPLVDDMRATRLQITATGPGVNYSSTVDLPDTAAGRFIPGLQAGQNYSVTVQALDATRSTVPYTYTASAQPGWGRALACAPASHFNALCVLADGTLCAVGESDVLNSNGSRVSQGVLARYSQDGALLGAALFDGTRFTGAAVSGGRLFLCGRRRDYIPHGYYDFGFVGEFDLALQNLWIGSLGSDAVDGDPRLAAASDGLYVAASGKISQAPGRSLVVERWSLNGRRQWRQWREADDEENLRDLALDSSGNLWLAGSTLPSGRDHPIAALLTKLDAQGGLLWERRYAQSPGQEFWAVCCDDSGGVFAATGTGPDPQNYPYYNNWELDSHSGLVHVSTAGDLLSSQACTAGTSSLPRSLLWQDGRVWSVGQAETTGDADQTALCVWRGDGSLAAVHTWKSWDNSYTDPFASPLGAALAAVGGQVVIAGANFGIGQGWSDDLPTASALMHGAWQTSTPQFHDYYDIPAALSIHRAAASPVPDIAPGPDMDYGWQMPNCCIMAWPGGQ